MNLNKSPRALAEGLRKLSACIEPPLLDLEQLRRDLIESKGMASHWPGGTAKVGPTTDLLEAALRLARRLEFVLSDLHQANPSLSGWESCFETSGPPSVPRGSDRTVQDSVDRWWMPSLVLLAYQNPAIDANALALLDRWLRTRSRLSHIVVDEMIDDIAGLSLSPWPLVDDRARVRFPRGNSAEIAIPIESLQRAVHASRKRFAEAGLIPAELAGRPIELGDVFAAEIEVLHPQQAKRKLTESELDTELGHLFDDEDEDNVDPSATWRAERVELNNQSKLRRAHPIIKAHVAADHRLDDADLDVVVRAGSIRLATPSGAVVVQGILDSEGRLPIVDVSWDARETAKLSFAAAHESSGVFDGLLASKDEEAREAFAGTVTEGQNDAT